MRFIRKGLVADAYQWFPYLAHKTPNYYWDETRRGWWIIIGGEKKKIDRGDWIVTEITGKKEIVRDADFDLLY